jgi:lipopolysaccharide/colanic/teichoic acid biosynthesis glycosyltransferase
MKRVSVNGAGGEHMQRSVIGRSAAFLLCVLGFPIHLLICICIKLADGGGPLYRDQRAGRFGKPFSMLKYRTMKVDSKPLIRAGCKLIVEANDARVTPLGRLLRCGVDELAQLANIVRGDMCWIGPRPVPISMLSKYGPVIRERFRIQPGITGLAQVLDSRSCSSARVFAIDIWYVTHRNLWLDLWIIATTPVFMCGWRSVGHNRLNGLLELPEFRETERRCQHELGPDVGNLAASGVMRG